MVHDEGRGPQRKHLNVAGLTALGAGVIVIPLGCMWLGVMLLMFVASRIGSGERPEEFPWLVAFAPLTFGLGLMLLGAWKSSRQWGRRLAALVIGLGATAVLIAALSV